MSLTLLAPRPFDDPDTETRVDVAIPVYNEEQRLAVSVTTLRAFLDSSFPFGTRIVVVDNASTDGTWSVARRLAESVPGVDALHLDRKGRGRAIRAAWSRSTAHVVAYMDVDLATDLDALLPLVAPLVSGHSDLSIGTRLAPGAHVIRGARRELLSRSYNLLVRLILASSCTDVQCGFKALRRDTAIALLPLVEDEEWFFDTELLVVAQRMGLRIHEVPVDWVDDLDSRVDILSTAWQDLCGLGRLARPLARRTARRADGAAAPTAPAGTADGRRGQALPDQVPNDVLLRFAGVGVVSTAAYLAVVASLEATLGIYLANVVAVAVCGVGNTAVHHRVARRLVGVPTAGRRCAVGAALVGVSVAGTTTALAAVRATGVDALGPELAVLAVAGLAAAGARFAILRSFVFRPRYGAHLAAGPVTGRPAGAGPPPTTAPGAAACRPVATGGTAGARRSS